MFPFTTTSHYSHVLRGDRPQPTSLSWLPWRPRRVAHAQTKSTESPSKATSKRDRSRHPGKAVLAGGLSGAIEISITYPTEYVKTQMQLYENIAKGGPIQCVRDTVARDGFFGLYRGLSCLLFFSIPKNGARFLAFEFLRGKLEDDDGQLSTGRTMLAGLGSGVFEAVTVVTPMETIKVKLIHDQLSRAKPDRLYKSFFHGVYTIVKQNGLAATYQGVIPTILKQGSNQMIRWTVYKRMQRLIAPEGDVSKLHAGHTALCGAVAGAASVYGNTPIDVVKTRLQGLDAAKYNGTLDCIRKIYRDEGAMAFYKGVTPRLTRVCADVAIVMVVYEQVMKFLDSVWDTDSDR